MLFLCLSSWFSNLFIFISIKVITRNELALKVKYQPKLSIFIKTGRMLHFISRKQQHAKTIKKLKIAMLLRIPCTTEKPSNIKQRSYKSRILLSRKNCFRFIPVNVLNKILFENKAWRAFIGIKHIWNNILQCIIFITNLYIINLNKINTSEDFGSSNKISFEIIIAMKSKVYFSQGLV